MNESTANRRDTSAATSPDARPTDVVVIDDDELPAAQEWAYAYVTDAAHARRSYLFVKKSKMPAVLEHATALLAENGVSLRMEARE